MSSRQHIFLADQRTATAQRQLLGSHCKQNIKSGCQAKTQKAQKFALTILILNQCRPRKLINLSLFTVTNSVSGRYTTSWEIWQQFQ
jgi:hypothetical protein